MQRIKVNGTERSKKEGGNYFSSPKTDVDFISSGCKTLDLALGGGWAENKVGNIVGDKCLSGDTVISMQRGAKPHKLTMRQLFSRMKGDHWNRNPDAETYLLADIGGHAGMHKVLDVVASGEKMLYEITNDRGMSIKASKDHKFLTTDEGWSCLADELGVGSIVKCWRGTRGAAVRNRTVVKRAQTYSIPYHPFAHRNVVAGKDYKRLPTARLIEDGDEWHDFGGIGLRAA